MKLEEIEKDTYSKSTRELESLSLDLQTSVNSDHIDLDLPDDGEEIKHREFELSRQEWDLISPKSLKNTLEPGWTNIFNEKIAKYYPICVIKFLYNRINKKYTVRNCPFFVAEATCKFRKCFSFKFVMETPETFKNKGLRIKYVVTGSISIEHFSDRCSYSRHLVGENRDVVAKQLEKSSPSNYHYSLFPDSEKVSVAKHGNFNYLHSTDLLRKVKSQHLAKSRSDNDPWQDIIITKMSYASTIVGNHLNGYVQMLCHTPLLIHLYSEEQILLLKYLEKGCLTLHFDATGSIVRKLDKSQKKIMYYALSVKHTEARVSPIPLAEMISSEQTNVEISNFLSRWQYDIKKVTNKQLVPIRLKLITVGQCSIVFATVSAKKLWKTISILVGNIFRHLYQVHILPKL